MPEGPEVFRIAQSLREILKDATLNSLVTYEHYSSSQRDSDSLTSGIEGASQDEREEGDGISSAGESATEVDELHQIDQSILSARISEQRHDNIDSRVIGVYTKGKRAVIILEGGRSILLTFAIDGRLDYDIDSSRSEEQSENELPTDSTVALLTFSKEQTDEKKSSAKRRIRVVLRDPRKLASALLDRTRTILTTMLPSGFDPLQTVIGLREWTALCNLHPGSLVATFLTKQHFVAGIGNRYRSEIIHVANIPPQSRIRDLCVNDIEVLLITIGRVLNAASRGQYTYAVYGRKKALPSGSPVIRAEVAKGVLVWTTAKSVVSARRPKKQVSKPDAGIDLGSPPSGRRIAQTSGRGVAQSVAFLDRAITSCSGGRRTSQSREMSVPPKKARKTASKAGTVAAVSARRSASPSQTDHR